MPIDPIKIPQNVRIEDRVVGPLSLRQIIIMAIGGGFSYMLYTLVQRSYGHVNIPLTVVIWIPAALAAAFAVVNINDLSLLRICLLFMERIQKPSVRTWAPRTGISISFHTNKVLEEKAKSSAPAENTQKNIAELSSVVDRAMPENTVITAPQKQAEPVAAVAAPVVADVAPAEPKKTPTPVNPAQVSVDAPPPPENHMSDLSIFRDIFPPSTTWQA